MTGALPINIQAALNAVRSSRTNMEKIIYLEKFVEEFYKTIGILFLTRYNRYIQGEECSFNQDIINLIDNFFLKPSFDSWIQLCKLCGDQLSEIGDEFAKSFQRIAYMQFNDDDSKKAKIILKGINEVKGNQNFSLPKRVCMAQLFEIMRELRNFTVHEWTNNPHLKKLIDSGIDSFIIEKNENFFSYINVQFLKVMSVEPNFIEVFILDGINTSSKRYPYPLESIPLWEATYIIFENEVDPLKFFTFLLKIDEERTRMFVYTSGSLSHEKFIAKYDNLPISGDIGKNKIEFKSLYELMSIPADRIITKFIETAAQKFNKIAENNGIIHNLYQVTPDYISRSVVETELFNKIAHPKLYITTLDGGGGFGKTELAKKVLWDIINGYEPYAETFKNLDYIIWLSAKSTDFVKGQIVTTTQSFRNIEDLLNCIFYVTNNPKFIKLPIGEKINASFEIFNHYNQTILALDNLETVDDIEAIWKYIDDLGREVKSDIKIIITSRILSAHGDQRLNVRAMTASESKELVKKEVNRMGLSQIFQNETQLEKIASISANIPLLIKHFVSLIARGYTLDEIEDKIPKDEQEILKFSCEYQWRDLTFNAKKLLIGIAKNGGRLNFSQAKLLCNLDDSEFFNAREELQNRSFLVDTELINSILETLSPITLFVKSNFALYPEILDDINDHMDLIADSDENRAGSMTGSLIHSDEITLNNFLQKADMLIRRGEIIQAYKWHNEAIKRFPANSLAWSSIGDFEFKYLEDDEKARSSFDTAISLDPTNQNLYKMYARWEHDRGSTHQKRAYFNRSVKLNEKALEITNNENEKRVIIDYIASAYMKLGYIEKQEAFKSKEAKTRFFENSNKFFKKAVNLLSINLYPNPTKREEIRHNILDYTMMINAHLQLGGKRDEAQQYHNDMALLLFIRALKLDRYNQKLLSLLNHQVISKSLMSYRISSKSKSVGYFESILNLEEKIEKNIQEFEKTSKSL